MKIVCWRCWNVECKKDKQLRKRKASECKKLIIQKKNLETKNKTQ